jgi:hypothetical protein
MHDAGPKTELSQFIHIQMYASIKAVVSTDVQSLPGSFMEPGFQAPSI